MKNFLLTSLLVSSSALAGHVWPGGGGEAEQNVAFVWTTFNEWIDACRVDSACATLLPEPEARTMRARRGTYRPQLQSRPAAALQPLPGRLTFASFGLTRDGQIAIIDRDLYVGENLRALSLAEALGRVFWSLAPDSLHAIDVEAWELAATGLIEGHTTSVGFHSADHPELRWFLNDRKDLWVGDGSSLVKIGGQLPLMRSCAVFGAELVRENYANPRWVRTSLAPVAGLPGTQGEIEVTARCRQSNGQTFDVRGTLVVDVTFEVLSGSQKISNPDNLDWQSHPQWSLAIREDLLRARYLGLDSSPVSANN